MPEEVRPCGLVRTVAESGKASENGVNSSQSRYGNESITGFWVDSRILIAERQERSEVEDRVEDKME